MNSGELREEVTVLRPVDGRDTFGAVTTTYEEQQTLRMKVVSQNGVKADEQHEVVQSYAVLFFCYYWMRSQLTERHLLRWDGRLYRITSIAGNVRRNELQIATEQVNE